MRRCIYVMFCASMTTHIIFSVEKLEKLVFDTPVNQSCVSNGLFIIQYGKIKNILVNKHDKVDIRGKIVLTHKQQHTRTHASPLPPPPSTPPPTHTHWKATHTHWKAGFKNWNSAHTHTQKESLISLYIIGEHGVYMSWSCKNDFIYFLFIISFWKTTHQ